MNPSTLIGIVSGIALLASVLLFSAEDPWLFLDYPSLGIVLFGTMAATFISYPLREVLRIFSLIGTVLRNERLYAQKTSRNWSPSPASGCQATSTQWKSNWSRSPTHSSKPACSWWST